MTFQTLLFAAWRVFETACVRFLYYITLEDHMTQLQCVFVNSKSAIGFNVGIYYLVQYEVHSHVQAGVTQLRAVNTSYSDSVIS